MDQEKRKVFNAKRLNRDNFKSPELRLRFFETKISEGTEMVFPSSGNNCFYFAFASGRFSQGNVAVKVKKYIDDNGNVYLNCMFYIVNVMTTEYQYDYRLVNRDVFTVVADHTNKSIERNYMLIQNEVLSPYQFSCHFGRQIANDDMYFISETDFKNIVKKSMTEDIINQIELSLNTQ